MPIINEACVGCGQCAAFCPQEIIRPWGRAQIVEGCTECGRCAAFCPLGAIEVIK